jgi:hypothetical protein
MNQAVLQGKPGFSKTYESRKLSLKEEALCTVDMTNKSETLRVV